MHLPHHWPFANNRLGRAVLRITGPIDPTGVPVATGISLVIGAVTGLGAVFFRWLITEFHRLFFDGGQSALSFMGAHYVLLIPMAGGLLVGPLVYFMAREAKGHGVPEVMTAVATRGGRIRPRVAIIKSLASSLCIGSGGSAGREGPIVQIGSSIGSTLGQAFRMPPDLIKTFVACGAAGGISATFNAPLAGVFFGMEVILRRWATKEFGLVVLSSVVASATAYSFLGNNPAFTVPQYELVSNLELPLYIGLGIMAGVAGQAFTAILYWMEDFFEGVVPAPEYVKPAIGGLAVGAIGIWYPQVFGVGYGTVELALVGQIAMGLFFGLFALKILATALTLGSGGSGGIFAPSLFMGAMLGGGFGTWVHRVWPSSTAPGGAYALVGMAAVFAGAARAPITSIVILFEMTRDYRIILPLMMAVVFSTIISRAIRTDTIYTLKIRRKGIILPEEQERDYLGAVTVGEAMSRDPINVHAELPVREAAEMFASTGRRSFPVVDQDDCLVGILAASDLSKIQDRSAATVADICTSDVLVAYPQETVHDALARVGGIDVGLIPVVNPDGPKRVLGTIRRRDVIRVYAQKVREAIPDEHAHPVPLERIRRAVVWAWLRQVRNARRRHRHHVAERHAHEAHGK